VEETPIVTGTKIQRVSTRTIDYKIKQWNKIWTVLETLHARVSSSGSNLPAYCGCLPHFRAFTHSPAENVKSPAFPNFSGGTKTSKMQQIKRMILGLTTRYFRLFETHHMRLQPGLAPHWESVQCFPRSCIASST